MMSSLHATSVTACHAFQKLPKPPMLIPWQRPEQRSGHEMLCSNHTDAASCLWSDAQELAVLLQSRMSEVLHVDMHPAARIGRGILMDHATGIVVGETAVVGDNVSLLHQVTLGGSGTGKGVRHPHVGECAGWSPEKVYAGGQLLWLHTIPDVAVARVALVQKSHRGSLAAVGLQQHVWRWDCLWDCLYQIH